MVYSNDPDERERLRQAHQDEHTKLADVVQYITDQHLRLEGQMPATAAHQETADALQKVLQANADSLYSALDQPYFGRLDYFHQDEEVSTTDTDEEPKTPKTVYLGISFIPGKDVFSWTAPVGRLWYTQSYEDGYTAPRGYIPTRVDLKRYIKIRDRNLDYVKDIFRRQLPAPDSGRQDLLTEALSGTGTDDGHLQVIIETIEPEQYENIANVSDKVLIVQGAAGSGKSEIGLHRIAFLLSPFSDIPERERPTPDTTLFVGPSQAFLEYAADILPALGIHEGVHRVKFSDWIRGHLTERRTRIRARIWNDLLNNGEMRNFDEEAESFKGSLLMADSIDKHVNEMAATIRRRVLDLPHAIPGVEPPATVPKDRLKAVLNGTLPASSRGWSLNGHREIFINQIAQVVNQPIRQGQQQYNIFDELERRTDRRESVAQWCDDKWPRIDFRDEYVCMLSNSDKMQRLAGDSVSRGVADKLAKSAIEIRKHGFDDSDLGALAYFDNVLNDTIQSRYRHIVVDEAQDISPIEFKLLAMSSANNWFTILGDTAQRLTHYRGIRTWKRDVGRVFGMSEIEVQPARRTYRSNVYITRFNNRILRTFDENIPSPIPFERDGHRVEYSRHKNRLAMHGAIIDDLHRIRSLDDMNDAVIAILARDIDNLNRFSDFCNERGINDIDLISQESHSVAQTVLARIPEVKGLEYDAVIVMGVNDSFRDTEFNKKLLYLSTTRAKHYLGIHWSGRQSPILKSITDRGINWYRS